ncbi:polyprenyl synthetase family protein [Longispora fulva]|uniref:Geranylgeranyl diphosphate synthase type I n=1 Tax=Longispora fulva TaxID=619741 RepID=A0A8J7G9H1_9ACTN|nr:polyprenyl synthetase family protein [Longispora fulva]MBG6134124.1 geranylgeranyl diphosphate synthase type I [Longispora fulva]
MNRAPAALSEQFDAEIAAFLHRRYVEWPAQVSRDPLDQLSSFILHGGKRLRPTFCHWGWRAAGGTDSAGIVAAASALEFFHAFALVHDDVMDDSDLRRGRPTVHQVFATQHAKQHWRGDSAAYGRAIAVLVGDLCAGWADQMFRESGLAQADLDRAAGVFATMRAEVVAGQYLDLLTAARGGTVAEAMTVARLKSARYTVTRPMQIGAALAGADPVVMDRFATFGDPLGEAFQLRDDMLGLFGDPSVTGKSCLDDLRAAKATLLVLLARDRADPTQRAQLDDLVGQPLLDERGADAVRDIVVRTGALAETENRILKLSAAASTAVRAAPVDTDAALQIVALAARLADRRA